MKSSMLKNKKKIVVIISLLVTTTTFAKQTNEDFVNKAQLEQNTQRLGRSQKTTSNIKNYLELKKSISNAYREREILKIRQLVHYRYEHGDKITLQNLANASQGRDNQFLASLVTASGSAFAGWGGATGTMKGSLAQKIFYGTSAALLLATGVTGYYYFEENQKVKAGLTAVPEAFPKITRKEALEAYLEETENLTDLIADNRDLMPDSASSELVETATLVEISKDLAEEVKLNNDAIADLLKQMNEIEKGLGFDVTQELENIAILEEQKAHPQEELVPSEDSHSKPTALPLKE